MGGEMTPVGPSPLEGGHERERHDDQRPDLRSRSSVGYARSRLMLGDAASPSSDAAGRRFVPPAFAGAGTQPGRERRHAARPDVVPRRPGGVAHVPAADVSSSPHSARERLVLSTNDSRPISAAPAVARFASLWAGLRVLVSA